MLPSSRRRTEETASREAAGESLWTTEFDAKVRVRLATVWKVAEGIADSNYVRMADYVGEILRSEGGWDVQHFGPEQIRKSNLSLDLTVDGLAAAAGAIRLMDRPAYESAGFQDGVNLILNQHRVAYKFVDGELVPFQSDQLMQEVVEPTLRLLVGAQFKSAHDAYLKALKEISSNDPGDAITDAATALQETLTALGCRGNALGPLLKDAKKEGLLGSHDQTLIDGVGKFIDWVSADRSTTGDAHSHSDAALADAWLMVHVVGALIVRLADPTPRGSTA